MDPRTLQFRRRLDHRHREDRLQFPRPFLQTDDAARGGVGDRSRNGETHSAGYDTFAGVGAQGSEGINQAFPSGHTTYAYVSSTLVPARTELVSYLEGRCAADGHGATLADCIDDTDADDAGGHTNAYTARMTYGFDRTSAGGSTVLPR